ncbi:MAG: hypothetical protein OXB88_07160 [Bacteriovoracales bacterium]|nr:hypothetical protein [Bacteriovoracales bacterium]
MDLSAALKDNLFYGLLFSHSPELAAVSGQMMRLSQLFIGVIFVLGALWEFFTGNRYRELILRTLLCLLVLACYERFLLESIKISFTVSENILKKNSKNNYFVKGFKNARETAKKELVLREKKMAEKKKGELSWWNRLLIMSKVEWSDKIATAIWLLVYMIFFILKIIYTTTFYLLYVFLSVQAVCFIFPPTSGSLQGALKTYISLILAPLVIAVILIVLDNTINARPSSSDYTFSETIRGLVQLLVGGILLLFAPSFAGALLDGRGSAMVGNKVVQVLAASMMTLTGLRPLARFIVSAPSKGVGWIFRGSKKKAVNLFRSSKNRDTSPLNPLYGKNKKRPSLKERLCSTLPWSRPKRNERKLSKRALQLIGKSRKNKLDLKSFSIEEKARAIETAGGHPKKYGMRRDIDREISKAEKEKTPGRSSRGLSSPIKKGSQRQARAKEKIVRSRPSNPTLAHSAVGKRIVPRAKKANEDFLERNLKRSMLLGLSQETLEEESPEKSSEKSKKKSKKTSKKGQNDEYTRTSL